MKRCIFILFAVLCSTLGMAQLAELQEKQPNPWRVGGGLGLSFGSGNVGVSITPSVGYLVSRNLETGVTAGYNYTKYNDYKHNHFSTGVYTNYAIIPGIFVRGHYEYFSGNRKYKDISESFSENALWLGAGYQNVGAVSFQAGLMYNVLYDEDTSIFSSPLRPYAGVSIAF